MKTVFFVAAAASAMVGSADAGFLGFAGYVRTVGANKVMDVFAVVSNSSDRLLNIFNANISNGGSFIQQAGLSTRGWGRDAATSSRTNGIDSFMTIGADGGGPYYGVYTASAASPDGNFTNWGGSGAPNSATSIPANAGWFLSPPTDPANVAENMTSGMAGLGATRSDIGSGSGSSFGIWCAHLVFSGSATSLNWSASATIKDGVTGASVAGNASGNLLPSPGALALLGVAGVMQRGRRK